MRFWFGVPRALWAYVATAVTAGMIVIAQNVWELSKSDWASWVQALGSIAAIAGAIGIASEQHRRDVQRRKDEADGANYVLEAELAWVSGDVLNFINQFREVKVGNAWVAPVLADDVTDMMNRLAWCRQRVIHKGQLAMIGALRRSLVGMARLAERHRMQPLLFTSSKDMSDIEEFRSAAAEVYNAALGIKVPEQYRA